MWCAALLCLGPYDLVLSIQNRNLQIKPGVEYIVKNKFVNLEGDIPKGADAIIGYDGDFFDVIASKSEQIKKNALLLLVISVRMISTLCGSNLV